MPVAPSLCRGRHFDPEIILLCVRWYLWFSLSLRDLEEIMAERGVRIDHTTIWRWTQVLLFPIIQRQKRYRRSSIRCHECLGGLLKFYDRYAA